MNDTLRDIGAVIIGVGGAVAILASRLKNENIKDLKERVEILESERTENKQQNINNIAEIAAGRQAIAKLEGKLESYKEIPLKFIPEALTELIQSNNLILQTLRDCAKELSKEKHGGGLLVKTGDKKPLDVKVED